MDKSILEKRIHDKAEERADNYKQEGRKLVTVTSFLPPLFK